MIRASFIINPNSKYSHLLDFGPSSYLSGYGLLFPQTHNKKQKKQTKA